MLRLSRSLAEFGGFVLPAARHWSARMGRFLAHYRIRISMALVTSVIIIDLLAGVRPRDLLDPLNPFTVAGIGLLLWGLGLRSWAAGVLHKHDELSTTGPYRLIRHPLYLGSLAMIIGFCLLLDDYTNLCVALGFAFLVYGPQVRGEERILADRFQGSWAAYAGQTRRFFPRRLWCDLRSDWRLSQWLANREYQAVAAAAICLALLKFWSLVTSH